MNRRLAFFLALAAQLGFLGWMVAAQERTLANGQRVLLTVLPFDPIDYLAGRYVNVEPAIARVDPALVPIVAPSPSTRDEASPWAHLQGTKVLVELKPVGGLLPEGQLFVAARVLDAEHAAQAVAPYLRAVVGWTGDSMLPLDFGLDRYYIPATGHDPSFLTRDPAHTVRIAVRVTADGRAVTEDLLVDGKPYAEWNVKQE